VVHRAEAMVGEDVLHEPLDVSVWSSALFYDMPITLYVFVWSKSDVDIFLIMSLNLLFMDPCNLAKD